MVKTAAERDRFVEQNLGLVHSCANRFRGKGIEYDDLFSAGCMGLVKAFDAFDDQRGVRFSTYAVPVILGEIRRLFRDGGSVKVSRSLKELSVKVARERERFLQKTGREPTVSEIAEELMVEPDDVAEAISAGTPTVSLTESEEEGGGQLDVRVETLEEQLADTISLKEVIGQLEPKDRALILLRYFKGKTQSETAAYLGMTQVQVSRREKKILSALRERLL
ncbi:MAG: sigma-70 family RNA polymerase sigma factor [Oscillospiraceae bacterium]|nr:sigma-70 family RNA polymerase sigma factor [Oscillospiraceae bacterium]